MQQPPQSNKFPLGQSPTPGSPATSGASSQQGNSDSDSDNEATGQPASHAADPPPYDFVDKPGYGGQGQPGYGGQGQSGYGGQGQSVQGQAYQGYGSPQMGYTTQTAPVVAVQPGSMGQAVWMTPPALLPGCPPGMEYLTCLDQLIIEQQTQLMDVMRKNKFCVMNSVRQQVYFALEESTLFKRLVFKRLRGFIYRITDNLQQDVILVQRKCQCCKGVVCCPMESCRYFVSVEARNGELLGYISNLVFCCTPVFGIFDSRKQLIAEIQGPCCPCQTIYCTNDKVFQVLDMKEGKQLGQIRKQWPGLSKTIFKASRNFHVSFPLDTDVRMKALMFGAVFVIDMILYEARYKKGVHRYH